MSKKSEKTTKTKDFFKNMAIPPFLLKTLLPFHITSMLVPKKSGFLHQKTPEIIISEVLSQEFPLFLDISARFF